MTKETRTDVQIYSAIAMLLAGVALATAGFIVPPTGEIYDSVLLFFNEYATISYLFIPPR